MKKILFLSCLYLFGKASYGQTTHLYYYDPKLINPAFAGIMDEQNYQAQYNGALKSENIGNNYEAFAAYSNKLKSINSGLGVVVGYQNWVAQKNLDGRILYNYQIRIGTKGLLCIGTEFRYLHIKIDYSIYRALNPDDTKAVPNMSNTEFNAGLGIAYNYNNKFKIGVNLRNAVQLYNKERNLNYNLSYNGQPKDLGVFMSYQLNLGKSFKLTPSIFIITDIEKSTSHSVNLNTIAEWKFLMFGFSANVDDYNNSRYSAGVTIKKKVQIITSLYNASNKRIYGSFGYLDIMLRVTIANKQSKATN